MALDHFQMSVVVDTDQSMFTAYLKFHVETVWLRSEIEGKGLCSQHKAARTAQPAPLSAVRWRADRPATESRRRHKRRDRATATLSVTATERRTAHDRLLLRASIARVSLLNNFAKTGRWTNFNPPRDSAVCCCCESTLITLMTLRRHCKRCEFVFVFCVLNGQCVCNLLATSCIQLCCA